MKTTYEQWIKSNNLSEGFTTTNTIVLQKEGAGNYTALSSKDTWEAGYKQAEKDFSAMYEEAFKKLGKD